jgi:hypothetical protein
MKDYIRAGMHLQLQKIGRSEQDNVRIIESFTGDQNYEEIKKLNIVGLDLDTLHNQAIHAIQVLLSKSNYQGDLEPRHGSMDGIGAIARPVIKFTPAEYYEAFGVPKRQSNQGYSQFRGGDRKQAYEALKSLYKRNFVISFDYKVFSKKKNSYISGSKKIYSGLFIEVHEDRKRDASNVEYLESITIELSTIFVLQLDSYNVLKPKDYISQIKQIDPSASKYVHLFIEQVLNQSRLNRKNGVVKLGIETLAYQLRMDGYIKNRKQKEIRKVIKRSLEVAKAMEFISDYEMKDKLVEFQINYDKLAKVQHKQV